MPEASKQFKVFLCHSSNDKPIVRELYSQLSADDWIDPWLDEEKLFPGMDWNLEIEKAVEAADAILVCLSNTSITKEGYVQRELRIVLDYADYKPDGTLYVIPVRLEDCEPPRRLRPWQYADYFPKSNRGRAYERLLVSLRQRATALGILIAKSGTRLLQATAKDSKSEIKPTLSKVAPQSKAPAGVVGNQIPSTKTTLDGHPIYVFGDIEFVKVPAGKFLMGSSDTDKQALDEEKPQHIVDLSYDYYMARFPTTNIQYADYVEAEGKKHPVSGWRDNEIHNHPVARVSWSDAIKYCRWLNEMCGDKLPSDLVMRLPTEAEWEKAARGANGLIFPWGDSFDKDKCNTDEGGEGGTTPVGIYSPQGDSPYGCSDMSGNVWEWTHSLVKAYPYNPDDGRESENSDSTHVVRGGSFNSAER